MTLDLAATLIWLITSTTAKIFSPNMAGLPVDLAGLMAGSPFALPGFGGKRAPAGNPDPAKKLATKGKLGARWDAVPGDGTVIEVMLPAGGEVDVSGLYRPSRATCEYGVKLRHRFVIISPRIHYTVTPLTCHVSCSACALNWRLCLSDGDCIPKHPL